jgi:hypothetical protein
VSVHRVFESTTKAWVRMYSDEGGALGRVSSGLWTGVEREIMIWVIRWN